MTIGRSEISSRLVNKNKKNEYHPLEVVKTAETISLENSELRSAELIIAFHGLLYEVGKAISFLHLFYYKSFVF